jgi:hypothetical protein
MNDVVVWYGEIEIEPSDQCKEERFHPGRKTLIEGKIKFIAYSNREN